MYVHIYWYTDRLICLRRSWWIGVVAALSQDLDAIMARQDKRGRTALELAELLAHRDGQSSGDAFVHHLRSFDDTRRGARCDEVWGMRCTELNEARQERRRGRRPLEWEPPCNDDAPPVLPRDGWGTGRIYSSLSQLLYRIVGTRNMRGSQEGFVWSLVCLLRLLLFVLGLQ